VIRDGHDGWQLETYSWSERTGIATLVYEHAATRKHVEVQREQRAYFTPGAEVQS